MYDRTPICSQISFKTIQVKKDFANQNEKEKPMASFKNIQRGTKVLAFFILAGVVGLLVYGGCWMSAHLMGITMLQAFGALLINGAILAGFTKAFIFLFTD